MTETTTLVDDLARQLPDDVAWLVRESDDSTVRLLVGERIGLIRGTLNSRGYTVREADVPVRDGWAALLEVSR